MKRKKFLFALCFGLAIISCRKSNPEVTPTVPKNYHKLKYALRDSTVYSSRFITVDVANHMINSYLQSINSPQNDTDLRSFSVNADSLRAYLSNNSIKNIKLMFAHTMSWINSGNMGLYSGYQSGGLTIIIAAYDSSGNYVYYNTGLSNSVLDYSAPCPYVCGIGAASSYLLQ